MSTAIYSNKNQPLGLSQKIGYGLGDLGFGFFWTATNLYLLFYYTDVLGLPNKVAGTIFMVAMIWDGISDPLVGLLTNKTRTRWGRYRPYLVLGAIPLACSFAFMFYRPDLEVGGLIIYAAVTHVIFRTCYTIVAVPYGAMMAQITRNSNERSSLVVSRMLFASAAGIIVALLMLKLAESLGNGDLNDGFFRVSAIFAALSVPVFFLTFLMTREKAETYATPQQSQLSVQDTVAMLKANSPFWLVFLAVIVSMSCVALADKVLIYYLIYALNGKSAIGSTLAALGIVTAISFPIWSLLAKWSSKRFVWQTGLCIIIVNSICLYFFSVDHINAILPFLLVSALAKGALYFSFWATLPDTVEFGEWKTGIRAPAFLLGLITFAQKVSLGIAMGLLGIFLDTIGYVANSEQSLSTLAQMKALMTLLPAAGLFAVFMIIRRYPLDQRLHSKLVRAIEIRQMRTKRSENA